MTEPLLCTNEKLNPLLDDELSGAERRRLLRLVESVPVLADRLRGLRLVDEFLRETYADVEPPYPRPMRPRSTTSSTACGRAGPTSRSRPVARRGDNDGSRTTQGSRTPRKNGAACGVEPVQAATAPSGRTWPVSDHRLGARLWESPKGGH